jgi:hypothetical protein
MTEKLSPSVKVALAALAAAVLIMLWYTWVVWHRPVLRESSISCVPCRLEKPSPGAGGFKYFDRVRGDLTICIPCSHAVSEEQRFVCGQGITWTAADAAGGRP